tara:strand:+ start:1262 stop:1852 length:591 start_codon:yes stop_codon:yes gene_type:complete
MNQTKQIIYEMLTQSTGKHMLDSGGDDDRHWQQNQKMSLEDFENEKEYEFFDTDTDYPYCEKSLFHHLVECCEFAERETMYFENWIDEDKYHYIDNPEGRTNELPSVEEYMTERFGQEAECINSYNGDCDLSQTIQFVCVGEFPVNGIIALSIHNGCDVRGGYTDYKFFRVDWDMLLNWHMDADQIRDELEYQKAI